MANLMKTHLTFVLFWFLINRVFASSVTTSGVSMQFTTPLSPSTGPNSPSFNLNYYKLLGQVESALPYPFINGPASRLMQHVRSSDDPTPLRAAQSKLIESIRKNDPNMAREALASGAHFLSFGYLNSVRDSTYKYRPIEFAIIKGSTAVLEVFLDLIRHHSTDYLDALNGHFLILAVKVGSLEMTTFFMDRLNAPIREDAFLFQNAIMKRAPISLLQFLKQKLSPREIRRPLRGVYGDYPFHLAVRYNNPVAFNYLYETDVERNMLNNDGFHPIGLAISLNRIDFVKQLIAINDRFVFWSDQHGNTLIHHAIISDSHRFCSELLDSVYTPLNIRNSKGASPLMMALEIDSLHFVLLLAQKGSDLFELDSNGDGPLIRIALMDRFDLFKGLLSGVSLSIDTSNIFRVCQIFLNIGKYGFANHLLQVYSFLLGMEFTASFSPQAFVGDLRTFGDLPRLAEYFLRRNVHLSKVVVAGSPILVILARLGHQNTFRVFMNNGADYRLPDRQGVTALSAAIAAGSFEIVRMIVARGGILLAPGSTLSIFKGVLLHGGSFFQNQPNSLHISSPFRVLELFLEYFSNLNGEPVIPQRDLIVMCLHFEIYLFVYFSNLIVEQRSLGLIHRIIFIRRQFISGYIIRNPSIPQDLRHVLSYLFHSLGPRLTPLFAAHIQVAAAHAILPEMLVRFVDRDDTRLLNEYAHTVFTP